MIKRLSYSLLTGLVALTLLAGVSRAADAPKGGKTDDKAKAGKDAKKPDGDKQTADAKAPKPEDDDQGIKSILSVLPLGQKNIDVRIPSFKEGKPSSFVHAGAMTRRDDEHMDLENTEIRMYGEKREDDLKVELVTGQFDINTQVLNSNQRSRVSRDDFQLEGDRMVFDTKSQQGKMEGNVHMIIHDPGAFAQRNNKATASKAAPAQEDGKEPAPAKDGSAKATK